MSATPNARRMVQSFLQRPRDAALALYAGEAAYNDGAVEVAVALWSIGDDIDRNMLRLENNMRAPEEARKISAMANKAFREHFTDLHARAIDKVESDEGARVPRIREAVWPLTHDGDVEFRTAKQAPTIFYVPGLPASPVEPNEKFSWVGALEAAWRDIREEYEVAIAKNAAQSPYVPANMQGAEWGKLRGAQDWSAIHLFKDAQRTSFADQFSRTVEALSAVDLVSINGVPLEAFFSRLKPGAHIPPHYGLTNSRVTVHLPLIAPENCEIRVGGAVHRWRDGEIVAFDDSFLHEAMNNAASDRVVLIFEAPHPDLSPPERRAIECAYAVRQDWLLGRGRLLRDYVKGGASS